MDPSTPSPPLPPTPSQGPLALAVISSVLGLMLFLTLGASTQGLNAAFGLWFTEVFVFLGVPWVLVRAARYEPWGYMGLSSPRLAPAALGFGLGVTNFFAIVVPIQYLAQSLAPQWLREMFDGSRIFEGQSSLELVFLLLGVTVAAPVCEEIFFRGVVQKGVLASSLSRIGAILVTAVVFSAFHLDPVGFLARVELGVLFGVLRLYTGSLWPSILAHSANNLVSSALFLGARQLGGDVSDEQPPLASILSVMAVGVLATGGLLGLARRFPALWERRQEESTATAPSPSFARLILPWILGAVLSVATLALVDMRGIRLSLFDLQHRLPRLSKDAPEALHAERAYLMRMRAEVRSGRLPMEAYEEERLRQVQSHAQPPR